MSTTLTSTEVILSQPNFGRSSSSSFSSSSFNYQAEADRVLEILHRFRGQMNQANVPVWKDPLSERILNWVSELLELPEKYKDRQEEELVKAVIDHFEYFKTKVAVDPIYDDPYQRPVLNGTWTYEEGVLIWFRRLCRIAGRPDTCPVTQGPFHPKVHELALAMIEWVNSLPPPFSSPNRIRSGQAIVASTTPTPAEAKVHLFFFDRLLKSAFLKLDLRTEAEKAEALERLFAKLEVQLENRIRMQAENFQKQCDEAVQDLNQTLQENHAANQASIAVMNQSLQDSNALLKETQTQLQEERKTTGQLAIKNAKNEVTIAELSAEAARLRNSGGGGLCVIL